MIKACREIGIIKIIKYVLYTLLLVVFKIMILSPCRIAFLKILGTKIGKNCVVHNVKFFNLYRGGFSNLKMGNNCFLGDETMLDMADKITLEDNVTLAERVTVLTHTNIGYKDHPLQKHLPKFNKPVIFKNSCFVGVNTTILPGVYVGEKSLIAAGSVVTKDVQPNVVVAGVPAKVIKKIEG